MTSHHIARPCCEYDVEYDAQRERVLLLRRGRAS